MNPFALGFVSSLIIISFSGPLFRRLFRRKQHAASVSFAALLSQYPPVRCPLDTPLYENLESVEWLNSVLSKIWIKQAPYLADILFTTLQPLLDKFKPGIVGDLIIERLTLGRNYPVISKIKTFRTVRNDHVMVDFDVEWISNFAEFVLSTNVVGQQIPALKAKDFVLNGMARLELHLREDAFFGLSSIKFSFIDRPVINMSIEAIASVDVMNIPALSTFLRRFLTVIASAQILWPKYFEFKFPTQQEEAKPQTNDHHNRPDHHNTESRKRKLKVVGKLKRRLSRHLERVPQHLGKKQEEIASSRPEVSQRIKNSNSMATNSMAYAVKDALGILHIRIIQAALFPEEGFNELHAIQGGINPYCTLRLVSRKTFTDDIRITQEYFNTNSPYFDEYFEMAVSDPLNDLLHVQVFHSNSDMLERVNSLGKDSRLASAWISVEEIATFYDNVWGDFWLPLANVAKLNVDNEVFLASMRIKEGNGGYMRMQVAYEKKPNAELGIPKPPRSFGGKNPVGVWKIHLLEGAHWMHSNQKTITDTRCDLVCGKERRSSKSCSSNIWGEYFEIPVFDPLVSYCVVTGIDEDPFTRNPFVGRCVIALRDIGNAIGREVWGRLLIPKVSKSSGNNALSMATHGWIRLWVSFDSFQEDSPPAEILINPQRILKKTHKEIAGNNTDPDVLSESMLVGGLEKLSPIYLVGLVERVPRSLFHLGEELVGKMNPFKADSFFQPIDFAEYEESESSSSETEGSDNDLVFREDLEVEYSHFRASFFTGDQTLAGTDVSVWVQLVGSNMFSKATKISNTYKYKGLNRDSINTYLLRAPKSLGFPQAMRIYTETSGITARWFLKHVELELVSSTEFKSKIFVCNEWIGTNATDMDLYIYPVSKNSTLLKESH